MVARPQASEAAHRRDTGEAAAAEALHAPALVIDRDQKRRCARCVDVRRQAQQLRRIDVVAREEDDAPDQRMAQHVALFRRELPVVALVLPLLLHARRAQQTLAHADPAHVHEHLGGVGVFQLELGELDVETGVRVDLREVALHVVLVAGGELLVAHHLLDDVRGLGEAAEA